MSNLDKSLNEFIAESVEADTEKTRFLIQDDQSADWALSKIKEAENELNKIEHFAETKINNIKHWQARQSETHENSISYFKGLITEYAIKKREENPEFKSIKLPSGRFGFRKAQPKWNYDDEKVVNALESNGLTSFVRVKKAPIKADIKKAFAVNNGQVVNPSTGEIVEGITVTEQEDNFNVKVE